MLLIVQKHSLCSTDVQSRRVGIFQQCVVQQKWRSDVKAVPTVTQIQQRFLL